MPDLTAFIPYSDKGDILTEMRFYVPNSEQAEDGAAASGKKEEEKKKPQGKGGKKGGGASSQEDNGEEDEEEEQITPAKILNEKIIKAANLEFASEMIATLPELPMIIPRGKYSFDLYSDSVKLHGRTNDYKILYKDIVKCFLLPKPDGIHMTYLLQLQAPLRQGQTLHHFIALQFEKEKIQKVTVNLTKEQLKEKYDDKLDQELEAPLYDVLSKLFKNLAKVNILIPGEFKSAKDEEAIKCSVKASDGHLYPLKSSLVFIHKPVHYIKHQEIKSVEFSRVGGMGAGMPQSRSFDMTVTKVNDEAITFAGIDKTEHKGLVAYLKAKNLRIRNVDAETNRKIDLSEGEDASDEDSRPRAKKDGKRRQQQADDYDDEDDEEDESFKDEGSEAGSAGEEGEEDKDGSDDDEGEDDDASDEDADMDDGIDKDELKALQKEAGGIDLSTSTRRTRGGARTAAQQPPAPEEKKKKK